MNSKERIYAVFEGRSVVRMPMTVLYNRLYNLDHFSALTGLLQTPLEPVNAVRIFGALLMIVGATVVVLGRIPLLP